MDDDDNDYMVKQRLGYVPYAQPPDLNSVRTRINNRQSTAVKKRMIENKNRKDPKIAFDPKMRTTSDDFWPSTPPEVRKKLQEQQVQPDLPINHTENDLNDIDLGIRESHSAPLDETESRENTTTTQPGRSPVQESKKNFHKQLPLGYLDVREDSTKYDAFRSRKSKPRQKQEVKHVGDNSSDESDVEYVTKHKVKEGVLVGDRPFSLSSLNSLNDQLMTKEQLYHRDMRKQAERALREDNSRAAAWGSKGRRDDEKMSDEEDLNNLCCLFPCCCCFCKCVFKQQKKKNKK